MSNNEQLLITNSNIVTPQGMIEGGWIHLHNGIIVNTGSEEATIPEVSPSATHINGKGSYILPGFIDIHVHGGAGLDFMNAGQEELQSITKFHAEHGTTGMLATSVTASREELTSLLKEAADFIRKPMPFAQLLGVHLEGPFISEKWSGAQNPSFIVQPQLEWLEEWVREFPDLIKIQTLAPEIPGAYAYIERLSHYGIVPACGHTDATFEQIKQAVKAGLKHAVHTFNAMTPLHHREPGTVGAVLTDDRIVSEIIADGEHVHPDVIRLLLRSKGSHNVILVTDAVSAAGMPDGQYQLGGLPVTVMNSVARLTDTGSLAGSTLTTLKSFTYMVKEVGVSIEEASRMASLNPARQIGLGDHYGSLEMNKRADVLILDAQLNLNQVIIGGRIIA